MKQYRFFDLFMAVFVTVLVVSNIASLIRAMPGEATWQGYAGDAAYNAILGGMSRVPAELCWRA